MGGRGAEKKKGPRARGSGHPACRIKINNSGGRERETPFAEVRNLYRPQQYVSSLPPRQMARSAAAGAAREEDTALPHRRGQRSLDSRPEPTIWLILQILESGLCPRSTLSFFFLFNLSFWGQGLHLAVSTGHATTAAGRAWCMRLSLPIRDVQCAEGGLRRKARAPGRPLRAPDRQRLKKENKQKTIMDTPRGPFPHSLARKTRAPLPRELDAQANSIPEAGKALRKRARLQVGTWPQNRKEHSPTHVLPRCAPGPGAGGHCGWRPARSARPDAPAPAGQRAPLAAGFRRGAGRRLPRQLGARIPITGSHGGPGRPAPAGAPSCGPAPPPAYSSPFMRTPSAAAAAASAAAVAVASRRIGWRPRSRHFPTARGACGSAAALQARPLARGQANRGVRGGAGRGRPRAGVPPGLPGPRRLLPTSGGRQSPRGADAAPPSWGWHGGGRGVRPGPSLVRARP